MGRLKLQKDTFLFPQNNKCTKLSAYELVYQSLMVEPWKSCNDQSIDILYSSELIGCESLLFSFA